MSIPKLGGHIRHGHDMFSYPARAVIPRDEHPHNQGIGVNLGGALRLVLYEGQLGLSIFKSEIAPLIPTETVFLMITVTCGLSVPTSQA
jgi:hypothetical protein